MKKIKIKKRSRFNILFFICVCLFSTPVFAQNLSENSSDSSYYVADAKMFVQNLENGTFFFVDSTKKMRLEDIRLLPSSKFSPISSLKSKLKPGNAYWMKIRVRSVGNIKDWWLILNTDKGNFITNGENEYVDVWIIDSLGNLKSYEKTGLFVPRSEKKIKDKPGLNRVFFNANNGETVDVYTRIYNEVAETDVVKPELRNPAVGISGKNEHLVIMFMWGGALILSIFSFFLYFFLKDKSYLFFGLYALTLSQHYLVFMNDYPIISVYLPEHPSLLLALFPLLTIGGFLAFFWFGRYFINLPTLSPRLDKMLKWGSGLLLAWLIADVISLVLTKKGLFEQVLIVFVIAALIFSIRISFYKTVLIRIFVAGAFWLFFFTFLGLLSNFKLVDLGPLNPWPVGQIGQLLIYTIGLAYKIRENERAKAQAEIIKTRNTELSNLYDESKRQKQEIELQKKTAEEALFELKSTQSQLIQAEKMASLGELTAGIAHEIQNPLNFVNNFSEVNKELLTEVKEEIEKGNLDEVRSIVSNVIDNEDKITFHGKRADAIVKSMLQHSRLNSGKKEPTDINALTDEYLRLSYHGLRAKDKNFNSNFELKTDPEIGMISVIRQDIGRVILNILNNAFFSVNEKKKQSLDAGHYNPQVVVETKKLADHIEISVTDNGTGIPQSSIDKIFQPFYTTKPAGQGTGLGLSLAYDIIKSHNGELKVQTTEGQGTTFTIELPFN